MERQLRMVATLRIDGAHASRGELGCDAGGGARGHSAVHAISMPRCASAVGRPAAGGIAAPAPAARRVAAWTLAAAPGAAARAAALALRSLIVALALMAPAMLSASGASAEVVHRLIGTGGAGTSKFGRSVALSANGEIALVGAPENAEGVGAAWVFVHSGSEWVEQAKLTAPEEAGNGRFGRSVALSGDGDTALIGAPLDHSGRGTLWVFVRSGSSWNVQAELTGGGEQGPAHFGRSVALSEDGDTAIVSGPLDDHEAGAVWMFGRAGSSWTQQGAKLTGGAEEQGAAQFGSSVALSAQGETALVGGPGDHERAGAAWAFERTGSSWTQQGTKLTGAEEQGAAQFGSSVALSADGETALVGGPCDDERVGAVWLFARSGATFTQQGAKLLGQAFDNERLFGSSVALSASGDVALVGDAAANRKVGGAWLLTRESSQWDRVGIYLTGAEQEEIDEDEFGRSVALTADGETALVGGPGYEERLGAAWIFEGTPVVTELEEEEPSGGHGTGRGGGTGHNNGGGPNGGSNDNPSMTSPSGEPLPPAKTEVLASKVVQPATATASCRLVGSVIEVSRKDRASVRLVCTGNHNASGKLTLTVTKRVKQKVAGKGAAAKTRTLTKTVTIAAIAFATAPNKTVLATLSLNKTGRSLLGTRHGRLTAAARLAKLAPAPAQTRTATVQLLLQKPASKAPKK
jgi:FG-GAP repeat